MAVILEEGIASYLELHADLVALITGRVYAMRIPQGATIPCLTFQRISTPRISTHDTSGATGDLSNPRFQFDAWAESQAEAKAISDALRGILNGKTGAIGTAPRAYTIRAALADNEAPEYDPESKLYRSRSDYMIWHEE